MMPTDRNTWPYAPKRSIWSWLFRPGGHLVELGSPPRYSERQSAPKRSEESVAEAGREVETDLRSTARSEATRRADADVQPGRLPDGRKPFFVLVLQALVGTFQLEGRASRREFGAFVVFYAAFLLFGGFFLPVFIEVFWPELIGVALPTLIWFVLLLTLFSVSLRRLHDTGRRGWWLIFSITNPVTFLLAVYRLFQPGDPGANEFGPPPDD